MFRHLRLALPLSLLLGACAGGPKPLPPESSAEAPMLTPEPVIAPQPGAARQSISAGTNRKAGSEGNNARSRKQRILELMRQSTRPINLTRSCSFQDETGYRGSMQIEISDNRVRQLSASFEIPDDGSCRIEQTGFRQVMSSPSIELRHPDGCTARIWTQGRQLTVSYTHCESRCSQPQAFGKVWPVLVDMPTGRCD